MKKFIFVVGPTASGKSEWAIQQAEKKGGVIFNCDSVQLYKDLRIGSAQPSDDDKKRVPHHLFEVVPAPKEITSAQYRNLFLEEIKNIPDSAPIYVVGGTGFYFLALEKGLYEIKEATLDLKSELENQSLNEKGMNSLFEEICKLDVHYSQKIHKNDRYRIVRAIEILRSNPGKTITQLIEEKKHSSGLEGKIEKVGMKWENSDLEVRIHKRTRKMLELGLVEETQNLLNQGLENWAPLRSVGYKETLQHLRNELPIDQLETQIVIATRQLAKKQRTWFQRDKDIQWIKNPSE